MKYSVSKLWATEKEAKTLSDMMDVPMNLKQKQKLAVLKRKREAFVDAYVGAQLKRANEIKEIKPFSSVVTFLDAPVLSLSQQIPQPQKPQSKANPIKKQPQLDPEAKPEKVQKQKNFVQESRFVHYAEE